MKRFVVSFAAVTLGLIAAFGIEFAEGQVFPNVNPPLANMAPSFSGLNVSGNATVDGFLNVGNNIQPKSGETLGINAKLNVAKGLDVTGTLNVNQFFTMSPDSLTVNAATYLNDYVNLKSNISVGGQSTFSGNATFNGGLYSNDSSGLLAGVIVGKQNGTGILEARGPATFAQDISVTGNANVSGNVNVTGSVNVHTINSKTAGQPVTITNINVDKIIPVNPLLELQKGLNIKGPGKSTDSFSAPNVFTDTLIVQNSTAPGTAGISFDMDPNSDLDLSFVGNPLGKSFHIKGEFYANSIGTWYLASGQKNLQKETGGVHEVSAVCPTQYVLISCNAVWPNAFAGGVVNGITYNGSETVDNLGTMIGPLKTPYNGDPLTCVGFARKNSISSLLSPANFIVQAKCFKPKK